jgi:DNA-directed RNA polymerase subunit delta
MKRVIVDYSKLTNEVLDLLVVKYPDGYDYDDIVTFQNAKGETVKAVEVKTEDTIYLVKISVNLEQRMEEYSEDNDDEDIDDDIEDIEIEDDIIDED